MHTIKDVVKQLIGKSLDAYNKKYTSPINNRIDNIVAQAGTDNTEIVDARIDSAGVSHTTLNNRILAEIKMTDEKLIEYSGSSLSVDDTMPGYLQNIEIKGNTIQNEDNLEDIRSVGDKIEGQELYEIPVLSVGKNLFYGGLESGTYQYNNGVKISSTTEIRSVRKIKVNPNSNYIISSNKPTGNIGVYYYDSKENFIKAVYDDGQKVVTTEDTHFIAFRFVNLDLDRTVQIEEGTVATPYEPYVEDKLTILSPVPLEKVGDIADRIICKDGVWGVEKNIETKYLKDMPMRDNVEESTHYRLGNYSDTFPMRNDTILCNNYVVATSASTENTQTQIMAFKHSNTRTEIRLAIQKSDVPDITTIDELVSRVKNGDTYIKYQLVEPTFIPLPHDQQVKLRTFANKTNISFLTEIEGTIKAQVPKSLGATVNTHTEQISNLNKELDRVKKLEESTVSTVETESDFTTVEATSNGYFEDVKLEGKTLATVLTCSTNKNYAKWTPVDCVSYKSVEVGKVYTIIAQTNNTAQCGLKNRTSADYLLALAAAEEFICKTITFSKAEELVIVTDTEGTVNMELMILEGDHTQNPPSYFEGLKSVGQDVDKIVVSSVKGDGNLVEYIELNGVNSGNGSDFKSSKYVRTNYITVEPNQTYYIKLPTNVLYSTCVVYSYNSNKSYLGYKSGLTSEFTTVDNTKFIRIDMKKKDNTDNTQEDINNCDFVVSKCRISEYTPHQTDKKHLLFYNNETQTWEKTILREWDSIEKHTDGKYYYHQRSGEVALNGSENWITTGSADEDTLLFYMEFNAKPCEIYSARKCISDKINSSDIDLGSKNIEGIYTAHDGNICIRISKTKLSTQDVQGFKQWLQANNVTVVYQLAQEKVYECTNIDLITYANETNYVVESGAIVPKTTLKVHNNISNVVSLLQKKVSLLESNMTKYMVTQNRMQLASTYNTDSVTFKVDYFSLCGDEENYDEDLYNLILNNILVGKDNYNYDKMFTMILDYASWNQISWEQFDILVGLMDIQHNPPVEEEITEDETIEETPVE